MQLRSIIVFCVTLLGLTSGKSHLLMEEAEDAIVHYLSTNTALQGKAEIVFLLDRSGSVGAAHFEEEKGFVESFLTHIVVDVNASRVAVISYSDTIERHIDYLRDPKTKCYLSQEMQFVTFKDSGATNIAAAIQEAEEVFKNARFNTNKVLVLISDGYATRGGDPAPHAERLKKSGVEIFCFGIGKFFETELEKLASSKEHVLSCTGFREFKRLARKIRGDPHESSWSGQAKKPNCDHLCDSPYKGEDMDPGCCDHHAKCSCALLSGMHTCVCEPGYYGLSGLMGECKACPKGTYKSKLEPTRHCTRCPSGSTTMKLASTGINDCVCEEGFEGNPALGTSCTKITCPILQEPTHGFILGICENTFGSECHFMCEDGYELLNRNDDIRTCKSDGSWSGNMPVCIETRCPTLPYPINGKKYCKINKDAVAGTKCTFSCHRGFKLHGSEERECLSNKKWSGMITTCKTITCNVPPPIYHGRILNCNFQEKPVFNQHCLYTCNSGFELQGSQVLICRENGKLLDSNKTVNKPFCKDITPPEITCQNRISVNTSKGRNGTMVSWTIPFPQDNSGIPPKLYTTPLGVTSPTYFTIGEHAVQYTAVDHSGLKSYCNVTIIVTDDEPPVSLRCPSNIQVSTNGIEKSVTWEEPLFEDNSGQPMKIEKTAESGKIFKVGRHIISYKASDQSGNIKDCIFNIIVQRTTCPYYPPPANGALTCNYWLTGKICQTYCNGKHEFVEKPANWYICNAQSQWQTIPPQYPVPWPDCARPTVPKKVRLMMKGFYYHGNCKDPNVQKMLKKIFLNHLSTLETDLCISEGTCSVENVKVQCGKETDQTISKRRKRDVWKYAESEELELEFEITIDVDHELNDTDAVLQNFLETIQNLKWELEEDINLQTHVTTLDSLSYTNESRNIDNQIGKVVLTEEKTLLECKPGSVLNHNTCVACAAGTFYDNSTQECKDCPLGYYQESEGQIECYKCPLGMSTLYVRTRNQTDCKGICPPGTYSLTGLETCLACPVGTYQNEIGQHACKVCPDSKSTASIYSTLLSDCKDLCGPGLFSETGLVPCTSCEKGYFQPFFGQTKCLECPSNFSTTNRGAKNSTDCLDIDPCSEENVCQNNGQCNRVGRNAICLCTKGFEGSHCKTDINECEQEPCFNNGYCINVEGSFYCNCTNGFNGQYCESEINECDSSPCFNNGTCLDKVNGYECLCTTGYDGQNCERTIEICYHDIICLNSGKCKIDNENNSSFCECNKGFTGIDCSIDIDDCEIITCHNNGSCIDGIASYMCLCSNGYTGSLCELNIDECEGNQCSTGSTCEDLIGAYKCLCPPGYNGIYCEIKMDDNFILNFPQSGATIANMATATLSSPLSDVTISMWVQTTDTEHSGTPLSYAVASTSTFDEEGTVIDNALTISDCSGIHIYVNNELLVTDVQVTDGNWHHLAFTWSSENAGEWILYKDGQLKANGTKLQPNGIVNKGGMLIIGQEQDDVGGAFSPIETFIGNITRVNIWNTSFSDTNITRLCNMDDDIGGKVIAWPDFLKGLKGNVNIINHEGPIMTATNENLT